MGVALRRNLARNRDVSYRAYPTAYRALRTSAAQSSRLAGACLARVHLGNARFNLFRHLSNLIWDAFDQIRLLSWCFDVSHLLECQRVTKRSGPC